MDPNAKSQIVERIKEAQNVLVTVSKDPSVDQLAAAIGLTLLLNKLDKHATAVFSGKIPSTLEFLQPESTLEQTVDSLRDFIVSLDKAKADKLRYKVEDDVVRIFITPYRTSLSEADLNFSQGDYNVDVVVALGVDERDHIDDAIIAHGRILHDATVIGVMAGDTSIDVGSINWQDTNASSLCEMLMSISESLKTGVMDGQIATAFLTGIVATTDRFKNEKTTPKVMTMSAQLMAAGANQQLIAEELTKPEPVVEVEELEVVNVPDEVQEESREDEVDENGVLSLSHNEHEDDNEEVPVAEPEEDPVQDHHIDIDDHGDFSNAEQLREAVTSVQERGQGSFKGKTISPLTEEDKQQPEVIEEELPPLPVQPTELPEIINEHSDDNDEYLQTPPRSEEAINDEFSPEPDTELPSIEQGAQEHFSKFVDQPPSTGSALNSVAESQQQDFIDPLAGIPQAGPMAEQTVGTQSPLLSTQHDAESAPATEVPSTPDSQLEDDGETDINKPLGVAVDDNDTLAEIEQEVKTFEGKEEGAVSAEDLIAQARKNIEQIQNNSDANGDGFPVADMATGASFVPLDTEPGPEQFDLSNLETVEPEQYDNNAPPSVPPPIMPFTQPDEPENGTFQLPPVQQ